MNNKDIKYLFRNYRRYKKTVADLTEKVEKYRTQAQKVTPSYSENSGGGAFNSSSKVEENVVKYEELLGTIQAFNTFIDYADNCLKRLKEYQRMLITDCLINRMSYEVVAVRENTTANNVRKIIDNAIKTLEE